MKSKISSPSRKYYFRIIQWTSAAVLLVIIVLSLTVYLNSQRILLEKEYESNTKVFNQAKMNIDMMDTMATNLCKSLYSNTDVRVVMSARQDDVIDQTIRINRVITTSVSANPYIHSVTIYNSYLNRLYNGDALFIDDRQVLEMIGGRKDIPKLKPISRNVEKLVNEKTVNENVFSYFMYERNEQSGDLEGAIAINVRTDWFLKNVKQINMIEKELGEYVFVLDNNNNYIEAEQENKEMKEWLKTEYKKHINIIPTNENVDFFESKFNGVNYLVTYSHISSMNINIIKVQKLSEVYKSINSLRVSVVIITLIFLAIAFLVSTGISREIYKPVGKLVQMISSGKNQSMENNGFPDEISYLNNYYKTTMEKLDVYDKEKYLNKDIMKKYWLNRLLVESHIIDTQKVSAIFEEGKICLSSEEKFVVGVIKIDNYKTFMNEYNFQDRELLRFAIINITCEVVGRKYKNEGIDMKEDHIALIIGVPKNDEVYLTGITELIKEAQNYIKEYFKLSVSACVSHNTENIREITLLYNKAIDNMTYRLKLGHSCIITPETIQENKLTWNNESIRELETLLIDKIKSADFNEMQDVIKRIFDKISLLEYDHMLISLISTASIINNSLANLKIMADKHKHFDFGYICRCIMEKETLDEIYDVLVDGIRDIFENESNQQAQSKNGYIVDAVKEFIQKNYQNSDLSLTKISTVLNISTRRLSKAFNDEMKMWVPDYINNIRLDKAAELLETTSLNVSEVVSRLGIDNETYFYGMFKKKFGLTPKEYAFKRIMNMTQE